VTQPEEDSFPELEALKAELAARHRRLVRITVGSGVLLLLAAAISWALLDTDKRPGFLVVPVGLGGFGLAAIVRGLWSAYTDIDTRPSDELVGVADLPADDPGAIEEAK
jgi:hypothetical protein